MTTTTGLALLLFLSLLPSCAARHTPNWSRVQAVPPKTKIEVQLYKDEAPQGSRKVKGRFDSAAADFIHADAQGRANAHLGEAGRAQGAHPPTFQQTMAGVGRPWRFPFCYWNSILAASRPALPEGFMATQ